MASADFIDNIQYIVNEYMKLSSYSVGIQDLMTPQETQDQIKETIRGKRAEVDALIAQTKFGAFTNETGKSNMEEFESRINVILGEANTMAKISCTKVTQYKNSVKHTSKAQVALMATDA
jgi:DNA-directed RNA polymerase beta' subunit